MQNIDRIGFIQKQVSPDSEIIYDLCCDHGMIGEYFLGNQKKVIFVDRVPSIIEKLERRIMNLGADIPSEHLNLFSIDAKLLKIPQTDLKTTFIIAGIGGKLAIEILKNVIPQMAKDDEIILSAQSDLIFLREFLGKSKCKLVSETLINDHSKFYEILKLGLKGDKHVTPFGEGIWEVSELNICLAYLNELCQYYALKFEFDSKFERELTKYQQIALNLRQNN